MTPGHPLFEIPFAQVRCYRGATEDNSSFLWLEVQYGKHVLTPSAAGAPLRDQADELHSRLSYAIERGRRRREEGGTNAPG